MTFDEQDLVSRASLITGSISRLEDVDLSAANFRCSSTVLAKQLFEDSVAEDQSTTVSNDTEKPLTILSTAGGLSLSFIFIIICCVKGSIYVLVGCRVIMVNYSCILMVDKRDNKNFLSHFITGTAVTISGKSYFRDAVAADSVVGINASSFLSNTDNANRVCITVAFMVIVTTLILSN